MGSDRREFSFLSQFHFFTGKPSISESEVLETKDTTDLRIENDPNASPRNRSTAISAHFTISQTCVERNPIKTLNSLAYIQNHIQGIERLQLSVVEGLAHFILMQFYQGRGEDNQVHTHRQAMIKTLRTTLEKIEIIKKIRFILEMLLEKEKGNSAYLLDKFIEHLYNLKSAHHKEANNLDAELDQLIEDFSKPQSNALECKEESISSPEKIKLRTEIIQLLILDTCIHFIIARAALFDGKRDAAARHYRDLLLNLEFAGAKHYQLFYAKLKIQYLDVLLLQKTQGDKLSETPDKVFHSLENMFLIKDTPNLNSSLSRLFFNMNITKVDSKYHGVLGYNFFNHFGNYLLAEGLPQFALPRFEYAKSILLGLAKQVKTDLNSVEDNIQKCKVKLPKPDITVIKLSTPKTKAPNSVLDSYQNSSSAPNDAKEETISPKQAQQKDNLLTSTSTKRMGYGGTE